MTTMHAPGTCPLTGQGLTLAYESVIVSRDLDVEIPAGSFTVIVGPNGCGKSTLLKALGRTLKPRSGVVTLDGRPITSYSAKQVARRLSLLPQAPVTPEAITVRTLVGRGRYAHQSLLRQWSNADAEAVSRALVATGTSELADRRVADLSGGQRQRVWLAMVLAQEAGIVLLDEPTTFLDIAHQLDVLELCAQMHREGRTLVAVLHDLSLAARYATHMIAMSDGEIRYVGTPAEVITAERVAEVFDLPCRVVPDPETGTPLVVPVARPLPGGEPDEPGEPDGPGLPGTGTPADQGVVSA